LCLCVSFHGRILASRRFWFAISVSYVISAILGDICINDVESGLKYMNVSLANFRDRCKRSTLNKSWR
jgi:hypothetical protein